MPRPNRFYSMLLGRLTDHRSMQDGTEWSSQADFVARLSDWGLDVDPLWPMHAAERDALLALSVPYFATPSDVGRARACLADFDEREIAWQVEVIRQSTATLLRSPDDIASAPTLLHAEAPTAPDLASLLARAGKLAEELA